MVVDDDTACVLEAAAVLSRLLAVESCGQCPPCKLGTPAMVDWEPEEGKFSYDTDYVEWRAP